MRSKLFTPNVRGRRGIESYTYRPGQGGLPAYIATVAGNVISDLKTEEAATPSTSVDDDVRLPGVQVVPHEKDFLLPLDSREKRMMEVLDIIRDEYFARVDWIMRYTFLYKTGFYDTYREVADAIKHETG